MNAPQSRREFLADVGKGTLLATLGPTLAAELGITTAVADEATPALTFGSLEPLVCFMQETPVSKLQPALAAKLQQGVPLKQLVAAGVLANARSFGGEDYIGFHTLMALGPALQMAALMPDRQQPLPVFKVLYRNTNRIQEHGGRAGEVLHPVTAGAGTPSSSDLHEAVKRRDSAAAEAVFASLMRNSADAGFNALLECVQDNPEVHRTALPYRAWDLLDLVGREHATTMLRMSLRYCLNAEKQRRPEWDEHGTLLTRLIDEHKLMDHNPGTRRMEDGVMEKLSLTIFAGTPAEAAGAVTEALAEGFAPRDIGEAISLAANQLLLRDHGRLPEWEAPGKPPGSVHGDSIGVHACDAIHAWRNLSEASQGRNVFACLILGAWQAARDKQGQPFAEWQPVPSRHQLNAVTAKEAAGLLAELDTNIRQNLQGHSAAVVERCGTAGVPAKDVFEVMLRHAVSEDGSLHAEKYFQTAWDEFHRTRPAFRWRHLLSLARVTASEYGRPAAGQAEARALFGV